jgi:hypothetical protein
VREYFLCCRLCTGSPRGVGGRTTHRFQLKLQNWRELENWTSGVDLSRLLDSLELSIVTSNEALYKALKVQRHCLAASLHSSSPRLSIHSMISTTLLGRKISMQYMEGGSFKIRPAFLRRGPDLCLLRNAQGLALDCEF